MIMPRENWSAWKKPVPAPLCPPQIQHRVAWRNLGICGDRPVTKLPESWHDPHSLFVHMAHSKRHFKSYKVAGLCTSKRYKLQVSRHVMFHCVSPLFKLKAHTKHQQWDEWNIQWSSEICNKWLIPWPTKQLSNVQDSNIFQFVLFRWGNEWTHILSPPSGCSYNSSPLIPPTPHHLPAATTPLKLFPLPPPSACSYNSSPLIPPNPICLQLLLLSSYSPYPPPSACSYNSSPLIPPTPHHLPAATTPLHLFLPLPAVVNSSTICSAAGSLCMLL